MPVNLVSWQQQLVQVSPHILSQQLTLGVLLATRHTRQASVSFWGHKPVFAVRYKEGAS